MDIVAEIEQLFADSIKTGEDIAQVVADITLILTQYKMKRKVNMKCFGRLPKKNDARTLKLEKYAASLSAPPATCDWTAPTVITDWKMLKNDAVGDCVLASALHLRMAWDANEALPVPTFADNDVLNEYYKLEGCRNCDMGLNLQDVLNSWKMDGIFGDKIFGYASIDPSNQTLLKQAISLFGGVFIGISVVQQYLDCSPGGTWSATSGRSLGGHGICLIGYDADTFTLVSWGSLYKITNASLKFCMDECYAVLSEQDWAKDFAPNGLDCATLEADLAAI